MLLPSTRSEPLQSEVVWCAVAAFGLNGLKKIKVLLSVCRHLVCVWCFILHVTSAENEVFPS